MESLLFDTSVGKHVFNRFVFNKLVLVSWNWVMIFHEYVITHEYFFIVIMGRVKKKDG